MGLFDFFKKDKETPAQQTALDAGLEKTKTSLFAQLSKAVAGKSTVDEDVLDDLESLLVHADVGIETTVKVIERIEARVARDKYVGTSELDRILREGAERAGAIAERVLAQAYDAVGFLRAR